MYFYLSEYSSAALGVNVDGITPPAQLSTSVKTIILVTIRLNFVSFFIKHTFHEIMILMSMPQV